MRESSGTGVRAPGQGLSASRMPGHWLLARLGKRVLRPGGLELTREMLGALGIGPRDHVVEFAPGLGATARMALARGPASYVGIERDEAAARSVREYLRGEEQRCVVGDASETGLSAGSATVVYGEAMLTMQRPRQKERIVGEAYRVLAAGGRYAVHELCLVPESLDAGKKSEIERALSEAIHVGARPLTVPEWRSLLEGAGFEARVAKTAPMHLLEPRRLVKDEGLGGALRFARNVLRDGESRERVLAMRRVFRRYREHLAAVALVAVKPG